MAHPFLDRLKEGPMLCDGAMGTEIYTQGGSIDRCFDELNLSDPVAVQNIHRQYINAGADIIETNTFGANRYKLEQFGLADKVRDINFRGAKNGEYARETSGRPVFVAGSIGPTGRTLQPIGSTDPAKVRAAFRDQVGALLEGGVDLIMIETMNSIEEATEAVKATKEVCDLPIVAQMTFTSDGTNSVGQPVADVAQALHELGVDIIGVNCGTGAQGAMRTIRKYVRTLPDEFPISAQPNAGWPSQVGDRLIYPSSPQYLASFATDAIKAGAVIVGGCCGTNAEHIAAMRVELDHLTGQESSPSLQVVSEGARSKELLPPDEPTGLAKKLGKQFFVSVELDPPRGLNPEKMLRGAEMLRDAGVDAVNVADSPMARIRMSALALCYLVQERVGVEAILHFTTRDRNLMGLQSDLIGAHAIGVRNIIALTGDPPNLEKYPNVSPVYDLESTGLVKVLTQMNEGTDAMGASIGQQASFTIAVGADPTRDDLDHEADRLYNKISAGADVIMTQPIYEMKTWHDFVAIYERKYGPIPLPILLGILPLYSHRHAEFLYNEVPGIQPTDEIRERMRKAGSEARSEGVKVSQELLAEARDYVHGTYIMPSFGRYSMAVDVLDVLENKDLTAPMPSAAAD